MEHGWGQTVSDPIFSFPWNRAIIACARTCRRQLKAATSFAAEAGQSYYFRTVTSEAGTTKIVPVDPAEAQVQIASTAFSSFQLKK
jgi:hypothetical protein